MNNMSNNLVDGFPLSLCTTGMVPTKKQNPNVPIAPQEIASQIIDIHEGIGLTSVHLHARDEDEDPVWEKRYFEKIIELIRSKNSEILICVTTSGRKVVEFEKRSNVLDIAGDLKPDMASLTLSSLNFLRSESVNSPNMVNELLKKMLEKNIKPEFEVFDLGMLNVLKKLCSEYSLKGPQIVNLIFGNYASAQANLIEIGLMIERLPLGSIWSVGGIGKAQLKTNMASLAFGGGIRIGLEDNLYLDEEKKYLASNYQLVERIDRIAKLINKRIMKPQTLRSILAKNS